MFLTSGKTLIEILMDQLREHKINEKEMDIGTYIIGCISDDGYLKRNTQAISEDLMFSKNLSCSDQDIINVLNIIQ